MLEDGEQPPAPASDEKRTAQLNVRLTKGEKFRIEQAARQAGVRGISDFVRYAALYQCLIVDRFLLLADASGDLICGMHLPSNRWAR